MRKSDLGEIFTIENGILLLGAILLFAKTTELMTAFAPKQMLGYTGIEVFYGMACALMVEGLFVTMKFQIKRSANPQAWVWNLVLIIIPFIISALAQAIDSFVMQKTLASQPAEIQFLVSWGVPMIPALIVGLVLIKSVLDSVQDAPNVQPPKQVKTPNANPRPFWRRLVKNNNNGHKATEKDTSPNS